MPSRQRIAVFAAVAVGLVLGLTGCTSDHTDNSPVVGRWWLTEITEDDRLIPIVTSGQYENVEIQFESDGTFLGNATCNGFQGTFRYLDDSLLFSETRQETGGCIGDDIMTLDALIGALLGGEDTEMTVDADLGAMTWARGIVSLQWKKASAD